MPQVVSRRYGEYRNDELCSLYLEPIIVKMIKTARFKWLGHIARKEDYVPGM
jgi:hypothetical protein